VVELLVLGELLFQLDKLGLQGGLLQVLRLLVCVDDFQRHELVEWLVAVFGNQGVGFGGIGLEALVSRKLLCKMGRGPSGTHQFLVDISDESEATL